MGLDQYAYVAAKPGQQDEWWESVQRDPSTNEFCNPKVSKPRELAYWRKHPNLQGWMQALWMKKSAAQGQYKYEHGFNGVELELTREDIDELEQAVVANALPNTVGFFFGNPSDDYYRPYDLEFIRQARVELFMGLRVFYNSSW